VSAAAASLGPSADALRCLDDALNHAARGWRVVPLHVPVVGGCSCGKSDCAQRGKHPRIRGWQQRASSDARQIAGWWRTWPDTNVGLALGRESGVVVVDIDPRNGGDDTLHELEREHGELPRTPSVKSGGGGTHFYFRAPQLLLAPSLGEGVDLLGERRLVVAPPSLHASGLGYEWDVHPDEVELAAVPDWMLRAAAPLRAGRLDTREAIPQGERNSTLTRLAGTLRLVLPYAEGIAPALHAINEERCRPPLPRDEVEQIARSARRWHALPWLTCPRQFFADERLSKSARGVLRAICDHANASGTARPSYRAITRLTGITSPTTIDKAITELEAADRLSARRSRHGNVYRVSRVLSQLSTPSEPQPLVLPFQKLEVSTRSGR
jgi:Bifunctional DNA primase/polymerase, N-terminal/Primase C terminal 1 (PriCT-1)/Helix-turn-helix domain